MPKLPFLAGAIAMAFASAAACAHTRPTQESDAGPTGAVPSSASAATVLAPAAPSSAPAVGSFAPVVNKVMASVVSISATRLVKAPRSMMPFNDPFFRHFFGPGREMPRQFREKGLGSGVIIKGDVVVTNNHVVDGADDIKVTTADKREFKVKVIGADDMSDLAVLRLEGNLTGLVPIEWGDSAHLRLGDIVLAVGYPFGVGETVTMGIVSGLGRSNLGIEQYENFIQTDAAINPGNSGGALIDAQGHLVGINTAILSQSGGYMGIGFAIPSDMAKPIVNALMAHGKVVRGFLGISIQDITPELGAALKLPGTTGVLVSGVNPGTPAARAGLQRGDVILKVNGNPMESSAQLRNFIATAGANTRVTIELLRAGKALTLTTELGELPASQPSESPSAPESERGGGGNVSGLSLQPLSPDLRNQYNVPSSVKSGLVITDVQSDSDAATAGLREGDVILEVNRTKVAKVDQFKKLWKDSKNQVLLLVQRGNDTIFLVLSK